MATWLKQSTAVEIKLGPFVDNVDGFTAEGGLTIAQADVRLAKNGGDWAQKAETTTLVHEENGWYRCLLDTTDTATLGILIVAVNESGALPVWREFLVVAANIYDSLLGGGDVLDVSVTQWLGTAAATPTVAGVPEVDVTHWRGTAAPAEDTAGYPVVTVKDGTGAGEIDTASGRVAITETQIDQIVDEVLDEDMTAHQVQGTLGQAIGDPVADTNTIYKAVVSDAAGATVGVDVIAVQADTDDIQTRLPAALVGGRMDSSVGAMAAGTVTAAAIATDAIDADALAADAVAEIADGVWDEDTSGHVASGSFGQALNIIRAGTAQAGAATSITLDAGASAVTDFYKNALIFITAGSGVGQARFITAYDGTTKIATVSAWATNPSATSVFVILPFDAITGATAPTAAEVADAVWDEDATDHQAQGSFGQAIGDPVADAKTIYAAVVTDAAGASVALDVVGAQADLDDIQTRLPAALVGGRMDASVGAMAADVVTAAAIAPDAIGSSELAASAVTEIQTGLATAAALATAQADLDDIQTRLPASLVGGRMDASVGAMAASVLTAAALATDAAEEIANVLLDLAAGVETGLTVRQALRLHASALYGKLSGAATATISIRDTNDTKNRIVATVDADGNRSAVVLDAT